MKRVADLARMRKKKEDQGSGAQGILIVDKPEGLTSHDVVQKVRRAYGLRQVGHAGTLDPIASGVLVVLVGSATRIAQYLQEDDKEYHLVLKLGLETDTQDITGQTLNEVDPSGVTEEDLKTAVDRYRGTFSQIPPSFSAVKQAGQPLYKLARQGVRVQADPREVTIYSMEVSDVDLPHVSMKVVCSKGTYMRTLCHDIGRDLGVGGCMESLIRVRSGQFPLGEAIDLDKVVNDLSPEQWLRYAADGLGFPVTEPGDEDLMKLVSGTRIRCDDCSREGLVSVTRRGRLIALAEALKAEETVMLSPRRVLEPDLKELFKQMDK
jgi:tRNA pseudouridine(55) synthase